MLSNRLPQDLSPSPFSTQQQALLQKQTVIDLTASSPLSCGLSLDAPRALLSVGSDSQWLQYTPNPQGNEWTRRAIADYLSQLHGVEHHAKNVWLTASTSEAYSALFKVFTNPGDSILVPAPGYPLLDALAGLEGLHTHPYFIQEGDSGWEMDLQSLHSLPERTKILLLVAPHNPTGHSPSKWEWQTLLDFCAEHHLVLIVDEVFSAYVWNGSSRFSLPSHPQVPVFRLDGLSKSVGQPQLKLGWIYAELPAQHQSMVHSALEYVLDASLSVSSIPSAMCPVLLAQSKSFQQSVQARVVQNHQCLQNALGSLAHIPLCGAGWYQALRLDDIDDESFCLALLANHGVRVQPGFFFDFDQDEWIVLSLIVEPEIFAEGVHRMAQFYREMQ